MDTIISNSPEDTIAAGRALAARLRAGDVVALSGDLGAGKTHFAKGVVAELGGDPSGVTSPTFTLVHEYREGSLPVFHFDFYRLEQARELRGIGWEDYLQEDGILLVEWADRFPEAFPPNTIHVRFLIGEGFQRVLEVL
ncbi:MAG: tRNA threonylcarbamoyladenosine biosynthesis protein TsaE [Verrucomicrobia bacterium]|nr:MAG: tRNA threonylcarbamoyladenosine biosynthesis protein TsaE [Verrucomicrobiota bacterium]